MWSSALSAVRVHRASLAGSALVVLLASALLTATGAWVEAGARLSAASAARSDPSAAMLLAVASSFAGTAVLIALLVVASTFAGALRPRSREFALLRAVGATTAQVRSSISAEVLLVFAVAAPLGTVPGLLLAPRLTGVLRAGGVVPDGFTMTLSPWPVLATLLLLVPTALIAARVAARESARLSPATALQRSAVERSGLSRGRRLTALALAGVGLAAAGVPFVLPGLMGSAAATTSAFLLITAAALAGPLLVGWAARRGLALGRRGAVTTLALANARGFSRRLTGAIVPLALLLALGTVQSGVNVGVVEAAEGQVREGVTADLVVPDRPDGSDATARVAARVAALPGVAAAAPTTLVPAQVMVDEPDEDLPFLDALGWEPTTLRTVPAGDGLLDPDVRAGDLAGLADDGTITLSREAAVGGARVGEQVLVRIGGQERQLTVVALYDRGLGLGDYLVGERVAADAAAAGVEPAGGAVLVRLTAPDAAPAVRAALGAAGLEVTDASGYAAQVRDAAAGEQGLSTWLLLALLAFVAVAAANTLVLLVRSRAPELALLRRTGATRRQLLAMVTVESGLTTLTALAVGVACVLPALVGVGQGLLGSPLPVLDVGVLAGLAAAVVVIGVVVPVAAAVRGVRGAAPAVLA
ncbi:ABC transporter permease [Cellulomonas sp. C5510]|uniref:ABC transporter permease n=1 Tax=Cellulomonas sp. C5510 TaxID=2871170 RepID=UPI0021034ADA|nr:ABC transporter permease [Cellulomonas sp. C5510]